jgi:CHAT domain-containing protein/lipoprotein NlpI
MHIRLPSSVGVVVGIAAGLCGSVIAATSHFRPALTRLADASMECYAINDVGFSHAPLSEVQNALQYFAKSLDAKRTEGDPAGEARMLRSVGVLYQSIGENRKALESLKQSLAIYQRLARKHEEAVVLNNIGIVRGNLGDARQAVIDFEQALTLFRRLGNRADEASALNNLGQADLAAGEPQSALSSLLRSLRIRRAIGDRRGEAQTLDNIGVLYDSIGEESQALSYFKGALAIRRLVGDHYGEAYVLNNIGIVYSATARDVDASRRFGETLSLFRAAGDRFGEAGALNNLGVALASTGRAQAALEDYSDALKLRRAIGDLRGESLTRYNIALANLEMDRVDDAICELQQSLAIARQIIDPRRQVAALHALAWVESRRGNLPNALALITDGVDVVESMRGKILSEELRVAFSTAAHDVQQLCVEILMQLHRSNPSDGYDTAALEATERFRARALLDALADAEAQRRRHIDPALLARQQSLQQAINDAANAYTKLRAQAAGGDAAEAALTDLERRKTEYAEVDGEIRRQMSASVPEAARPLTADEIRSGVLDRGSVLVAYSLGEERSYLWLLTSDALTSFVLPPRAEVEEASRRVYALLTERNRRPPSEDAERKLSRIAAADAAYWRAAAALSSMLLGPIRKDIANKRLLIVPDGALFNIPFAALVEPGRNARSVPLVVGHEIVVLPSASTIAQLRLEIADRPSPDRLLAVIADPVYSQSDPRLTTRRSGSQSDDFERLPFAREEANAILSLAPQSARWRAFDFQASRSAALGEALRKAQYIHFATHAFVDDAHPELSAMVLSLIDAKGRERDGFLRLYDIANLKLSAEMVVLSGCRTGLGRQVRGEGVIGLARGFFYAGAARLVVSLWDVNDRATAELMQNLYRPIFATKPLSPAAALRAAQIAMWKQPRWRAPYYWAAFILSGEPR